MANPLEGARNDFIFSVRFKKRGFGSFGDQEIGLAKAPMYKF